jgi:hypothetical protein
MLTTRGHRLVLPMTFQVPSSREIPSPVECRARYATVARYASWPVPTMSMISCR